MRGHEGLVRGYQEGGRVGRVAGLIGRWSNDMGVEPGRLLREGIDARQAGLLVSKPSWERWFEATPDINAARTGELRVGGVSGYSDRVDEEYLRHLIEVGDELQAAALIGRLDAPVELHRGMRFESEAEMMAAMPHGRATVLPGLTSYTPHRPLAEHFGGVDEVGDHIPAMVRLQAGEGIRGVDWPGANEDYAEVVLPRGSRVVHRWRRAPLSDDAHEWDAYIRSPESQFSNDQANRYQDGGRVGLLRRGLGALVRAAEDGRGSGGGRSRDRAALTDEEIAGLPLVDPVDPLLLPGETFSERLAAAREWMRANQVGQRIAAEALDGREVHIPRALPGKVTGHGSDQLLRGLPGLPQVVARGAPYAPAEPPVRPEQGVQRFHYLGARVPVGEDIDPWRVVVREQDDGRLLAHDAGSLGRVRRDPAATEPAAGGASLEAFHGGPQRGSYEGLVGREVNRDEADWPDESWTGYRDGGLAGAPASAGAPGPEDELAAAQAAAERGVAQARQMWLAAGAALGGGVLS